MSRQWGGNLPDGSVGFYGLKKGAIRFHDSREKGEGPEWIFQMCQECKKKTEKIRLDEKPDVRRKRGQGLSSRGGRGTVHLSAQRRGEAWKGRCASVAGIAFTENQLLLHEGR